MAENKKKVVVDVDYDSDDLGKLKDMSELKEEVDQIYDGDDFSEEETEITTYPGMILRNYVLIVKIGEGSCASVWIVYRIDNRKFYAMKVQNDEDYKDGKREIKILKAISNYQADNKTKETNCVTLLDNFDCENKVTQEQMEYCLSRGMKDIKDKKYVCSVYELYAGSLKMLLVDGKHKYGLPIMAVKNIMRQLLNAALVLHKECNIIHTDIKPANILFKGINQPYEDVKSVFIKSGFADKLNDLLKKYNFAMEMEGYNFIPREKYDEILKKCNVYYDEKAQSYLPTDKDKYSMKNMEKLVKTHNLQTEKNIVALMKEHGFRYSKKTEKFEPVNEDSNEEEFEKGLRIKFIDSERKKLGIEFSKIYEKVEQEIAEFECKLYQMSIDCVRTVIDAKIEMPEIIKDNEKEHEDDDEDGMVDGEDDWEDDDMLPEEDSSSDSDGVGVFKRRMSVDDGLVYGDINDRFDMDSFYELYDDRKKITPYNRNRSGKTKDRKELVDEKYVSNCQIAVTDYGNSYFYDKKTEHEVQDRTVRSPEVILDYRYGYGCDVFSIACVCLELLTGDYIFMPDFEEDNEDKEGRPYNKDIHHLYLFEKILGPIPEKMKVKSKRYHALFETDKKNKERLNHLKHVKEFKTFPLEELLQVKYLYTKQEAKEICDFLLPALEYIPKKRITVAEMIKSKWLN